jgi:hypothetical protein
VHSSCNLQPRRYMQPVVKNQQEQQKNIERKCYIKNDRPPTIHALSGFLYCFA